MSESTGRMDVTVSFLATAQCPIQAMAHPKTPWTLYVKNTKIASNVPEWPMVKCASVNLSNTTLALESTIRARACVTMLLVPVSDIYVNAMPCLPRSMLARRTFSTKIGISFGPDCQTDGTQRIAVHRVAVGQQTPNVV